jgi:hypothetical protein
MMFVRRGGGAGHHWRARSLPNSSLQAVLKKFFETALTFDEFAPWSNVR